MVENGIRAVGKGFGKGSCSAYFTEMIRVKKGMRKIKGSDFYFI